VVQPHPNLKADGFVSDLYAYIRTALLGRKWDAKKRSLYSKEPKHQKNTEFASLLPKKATIQFGDNVCHQIQTAWRIIGHREYHNEWPVNMFIFVSKQVTKW